VHKNGGKVFRSISKYGVDCGAVFFFGSTALSDTEPEVLDADWGNILFVVGVSLAVVVAVLFIFPKLRGAVAQPTNPKE
jgi:hypothetical protein